MQKMATIEKPWEEALLNNLACAGPLGLHAAEYLRCNRIQLNVVNNDATNLWWKMKWGLSGPRMQPAMFLSRHLANKPPDSAWLMASIVHETRHLQQGFWTAFSVYGELDAWQAGFRFYETLPGHRPLKPTIRQLLALPLSHEPSILRQARDLINQNENEGSTFLQQVGWVVMGKKSPRHIYWIKLLPLNPLFSQGHPG